MHLEAVSHSPAHPRAPSIWRAWIGGPLLLPFLVALALRLGLALAIPVEPVWDGVIYARVADSLAAGEGYVRASIDPAQSSEPTTFYPVGFPAILAPLRWLGIARGLDLVVQALAGGLTALGAGVLGRRAGGPRVGLGAAWLVAIWPGGILLAASWMSEPFFGLFVIAASLIAAYARRAHSLRAAALAALVLGAGAYVRPTAVPMALALALGLALMRGALTGGAKMRAIGTHLAAASLALALALGPWALRNSLALDGPAVISTNGGANLLLGTMGEGAYARLPHDLCSDGHGEVARDRCLAALARERIAADPLAWLARGVLKLTHTFGHESSPAQAWAEATERAGVPGEAHALGALAIERAFWLPFLAAAIAGAVLLARTPRRAPRVALFAPIFALAALHFVFLGGDRYHAPVVPHFAVLAALALRAARVTRSPR